MGETIINGIIEASQEVVGQLQYAAGDVIKNIDQTYSPTSKNAQSGKAVAEAVATEQKRADNIFANALKGSTSGEAVRLTDVSPIEHTLKVRLLRKNLFDTVNAVKLNGRSSFSVTNNKIMVSQSSTQTYQSANVLIPQSLIGKNITLSAKSNTSGANVAALRIQWVSNSGVASGAMILGIPDSAGNIVVTGTIPTQPDETHNNLCLMFYSNSTGILETVTTYTATYSDIQIELGTTPTAYTPYITDFSDVTLKRCGRNLVDIPDGNSAVSKGTVDITESCPRGINIVGSAYLERSANQPFRLRINYVVDGITNYLYGEMIYSSGIGTVKGTIPISATQVSLTFQKLINSEGDLYWKNVQLEIGDSATDYRAFQQQNYIANADGTVPGVTSISDDITLMTDTAGAIIDCEYNRDINKAFAALEAAIATNNNN